MIELLKILKNKKTGKLHCPFCLKECKVVVIIKSEECLYCKKCKKYYAYPKFKDAKRRKNA